MTRSNIEIFHKLYFTENEWQMCRPGWVEGNAVLSVPLLFACNDFNFAYDEDVVLLAVECLWMIKLNKTIISVLVYTESTRRCK